MAKHQMALNYVDKLLIALYKSLNEEFIIYLKANHIKTAAGRQLANISFHLNYLYYYLFLLESLL